jgi:hypothetical protein
MHKKGWLTAIIMLPLFSMAQSNKFDSTVLYGKVGYRLRCNNKDANNNLASIKLIGFSGARDPEFFVKDVI